MPTIFRQDGFEVVINTHDHEPNHVHVKKAGGVAIINLAPIELREVHDMKPKNVKKAIEIVEDNEAFFVSEWDRIGPIA